MKPGFTGLALASVVGVAGFPARHGFSTRALGSMGLSASTDPEVVMKQTMTKSLRVGTNGGTAAGLVGSYDTVTRRIHEFHAAGIELFMLQFQPFEAEMARFAENIIPRFRAGHGA